MSRVAAVALLLLTLVLPLAAGCANPGGGRLSVRSLHEPVRILPGRFDTGFYRYDDRNQMTVVLFDGPPEAPRQAVTMRIFWNPRAGRTPIDRTATNATIHYVIFAGEEKRTGVYSGAGFVFPQNVGEERLTAGVWEANLRLRDASPGFEDLLGQALVEGEVRARLDEFAVEESLRRLNVLTRERLGYPSLVHQTPFGADGTEPLIAVAE